MVQERDRVCYAVSATEWGRVNGIMDYAGFLKRYNDLTKDLLLKLDPTGRNIFLSPYSILTLLLVLSDASTGTTRMEILRALYAELARNGFPEQMKAAREKLFRKRSNYDQLLMDPFISDIYTVRSNNLHTATVAYVRDDYVPFIEPDFRKRLAEMYNCVLLSAGNIPPALDRWAGEMAPDLKLLLEQTIDPDTVLSLINTVSFETLWKGPYGIDDVREGVFHNCDHTESKVNMLHGTEMSYVENEKATGFLKRFLQCEFVFMALLPKEKGDDALSDLLADVDYSDLLENRQYYKVHTVMPEFSFDSKNDLKPVCERLGVQDVFTEDADLSSLCSEPIFVNRIMHQTKIEVNRFGVRAFAVSCADFRGAGIPPKKEKYVTLDRPFVFAILHEEVKIPVFVGVVNRLENAKEGPDWLWKRVERARKIRNEVL